MERVLHPSRNALRIPLASVEPQFDIDAPRYRGSNPATYLLLALCHETLAGPSTLSTDGPLGTDSVTPDYSRMIPRIAEGLVENADGSWCLRLRPGVRSHRGNELSAQDVKWAFERSFALNTFAAYRWGQIAGVTDSETGVRVIDKYTVCFTLRAPNPNFASYLFLATPMIVDSADVQSHATSSDPWALKWLSKPHAAGFGPYDLAEITGEQMTFSARKDHWQGSPPNAEVLVHRVESRSEAISELSSSEPVYVAGLRPDEATNLRTRSTVFLTSSWGGHSYIGMNYNRPPFDDIRVRHALSYATPYKQIIEQGFLGLARPWHGPVPSFDAWYLNENQDYRTDQRKATDLLREAGYGTGFQTALYVNNRPDLLRITEILKDAYRAIGIDLEIRDMSAIPAGWCPPLYLRTECGHNINETVYDLSLIHI